MQVLCGDRAGPFFDLEFLAGHGAISAGGYARLKQARPRPASKRLDLREIAPPREWKTSLAGAEGTGRDVRPLWAEEARAAAPAASCGRILRGEGRGVSD
jgi:hypothetical protein